LSGIQSPLRRDIHAAAHEALRLLRDENNPSKQILIEWKNEQDKVNLERYSSHLYSGTALRVEEIKPEYTESSATKLGFEVVNACFDATESWRSVIGCSARRGQAQGCQPRSRDFRKSTVSGGYGYRHREATISASHRDGYARAATDL
jgi:hypothetical protein